MRITVTTAIKYIIMLAPLFRQLLEILERDLDRFPCLTAKPTISAPEDPSARLRPGIVHASAVFTAPGTDPEISLIFRHNSHLLGP